MLGNLRVGVRILLFLVLFSVSATAVLAGATVINATGGTAIPSSSVGGAYTTLTGPTFIENGPELPRAKARGVFGGL